jgi:putative membrane protein
LIAATTQEKMMTRNRTLIAALALLALPAALVAQHGPMGHPPVPDRGMAVPTPVYLMKAGASDLFERQEGQLMSSSRNPDVARFARQMVRDHTTSTTMVKAAAMRDHLRPRPPMLEGDMRRDLAAPRAARGQERDRLYIAQQRKAHQEALMLHQGYATGGDARALRGAASKIVPVVQHHIAMLERM